MSEITDSLLKAMEVIADKKAKESQSAITVECTIEEVVDAGCGLYKVSYLGNKFDVYSNTIDISYSVGNVVYVIIPNGDFSKNKVIIGVTNPTIETYVNKTSLLYDEKSEDLLNGTLGEFNICSYNDKLNVENSNVGLFELTDQYSIIKSYMKDYSYLKLSCNMRTSLDKAQQFLGNYGIRLNIPFLDSNGVQIVRTYSLDVSSIVGDPYNLISDSDQFLIFNIENTKYDYTRKISVEIFSENFLQNESIRTPDIFISNIGLQFIDPLTQEQIDSYSLNIVSSAGSYFNTGFSEDKILTPKLKVKGNSTSITGCQCYWFKENTSISCDSEFYNVNGGFGWQCLNSKQASVSEDGSVSYVFQSNVYSLTVSKSDIASSMRYKCVIVYNEQIISGYINIENLLNDINILLSSENNVTSFSKDIGLVNLKCELENFEQESNSSVFYYWNRYDKDNVYLETFDTKRSSLSFAVNTIDSMNTIGVTAIEITSSLVERVIGTKYITLTNTDSSNFYLSVTNGNKSFKYNSDGTSPVILDESFEILPLGFKLYTNAGVELTESQYLAATVLWGIPKKNTMIVYKGALSPTTDDDEYFFYEEKELYYSISQRYVKSNSNNEVKLIVKYGEYQLTSMIPFSFLKDGENGTNGTALSAKIVYKNSFNQEKKLRLLFDVSTGKWYNISDNTLKSFSNVSLTAELFEGDDIITSGYSVTWTMFDEKTNNTCLSVSNGILSPKLYTWANGVVYNNIVIATMSIDNDNYVNQQIIARYPIDIIRISSVNGLGLFYPNITGGFSEVLYASDGTNPTYDQSNPFKLNSNMLTDYFDSRISYGWGSSSNLTYKDDTGYEANFKPITKYDNGDSKNYITADLTIGQALLEELNQEKILLNQQYSEILLQIQSLENDRNNIISFIKLFNYQDMYDNLFACQDFLLRRGKCIYYCDLILESLSSLQEYCDASENLGNINFDSYLNRCSSIKSQLYDLATDSDYSNIQSYFSSLEYEEPSLTSGYIYVTRINRVRMLVEDLNLKFATLNSNIAYLKELSTDDLHKFNAFYSNVKSLSTTEYLTSYNNLSLNILTILGYLKNIDGTNYYYYSDLYANVLNKLRKVIYYFSDANQELNVDSSIEFETKLSEFATQRETLYNKIQSINTINSIQSIDITYVKPIIMIYNQYEMSNVNAWDGNKIYTGSGNEYLLAPQIGAGRKNSDNTFTGLIMGIKGFNGSNTQYAGLYGYSRGIQTINLDADAGSAIFGASGSGQIRMIPSGTSTIAGWEINAESLSKSSGSNKVTLNSSASETAKAFEATNGNASTYIQYNGFLYSNSGEIGNWSISENTLTSKNKSIVLDATNEKITIGGGDAIVLDGGEMEITCGSHFKVTKDGEVTMDKGTVGSFHLVDTGLYNDEKDTIISSVNGVIAKKGNIGGWYLTSNSIQNAASSPTVVLKSDGSMNFNDLFTVSALGKIKATSGEIGGWTIKEAGIRNAETNDASTKIALNAAEGYISCGSYFKVDKTGYLTASSGKVAGWTISSEGFKNSSGTVKLNADGSASFGSEGKFTVSSAGVIEATSGTVGGWTLNSTYLKGGSMYLYDTGKIVANNWNITAAGKATFSDINVDGGKIVLGGTTLNSSGTKMTEGSTNVATSGGGTKALGTYVKDLCVDTLTATKIKTSMLEADTINGEAVSWVSTNVITGLSFSYKYISTVGAITTNVVGTFGEIDGQKVITDLLVYRTTLPSSAHNLVVGISCSFTKRKMSILSGGSDSTETVSGTSAG